MPSATAAGNLSLIFMLENCGFLNRVYFLIIIIYPVSDKFPRIFIIFYEKSENSIEIFFKLCYTKHMKSNRSQYADLYGDGGKRYFTLNHMLKQRFGCKVMKVALNVGFTCPNIDGTAGYGGCTYCSEGSGAFAGSPLMTVTEQYFEGRDRLRRKWGQGLYIPYFQAHSNTYAPLERIRAVVEEAAALPDVCGIALATRPDCINEENAAYLGSIAEKMYLSVELGLQTVHDKTAEHINRCHTYADFLKGYELLRRQGVNVCVHIINGLPEETPAMMLETAERLSHLDINGIKFHMLHILKGTKMAKEYLSGKFELLTLEEYAGIVCSQIELLPDSVCIERITGDGAADELIAPLWSRNKKSVMNEIDKEFRRRDSHQGINYRPCG